MMFPAPKVSYKLYIDSEQIVVNNMTSSKGLNPRIYTWLPLEDSTMQITINIVNDDFAVVAHLRLLGTLECSCKFRYIPYCSVNPEPSR